MLRALLLLSMLLLQACGSDAPAPPPAAPAAPAAPTATVFDDQLKALEKARQVEEQAAERKRKQDEQIDGG